MTSKIDFETNPLESHKMITLKVEIFSYKYMSSNLISIGLFKEYIFIEFLCISIVLLF